MVHFAHSRAALFVLIVTCWLASAGCSKHTSRVMAPRPTGSAAPSPRTPAAVQLLQYCWQQRSSDRYRELFTDDYRFDFSPGDSAGNPFRDRPWGREDELICGDHLFVHGVTFDGVVYEPPATLIVLTFYSILIPFDDTRADKNPDWHKQVRAQFALQIYRSDERDYEVRGSGLFHLVRGDSANISADLRALGFAPDSNRWWIDEWEDETSPDKPAPFARVGSPLHPTPTRSTTLGAIKVLYR